jgi:hypothetical protein
LDGNDILLPKISGSSRFWLVPLIFGSSNIPDKNSKIGRKFYYLEKLNSKIGRKTYYTLKNWIQKMEGNSTTPKNWVLTNFWIKGVKVHNTNQQLFFYLLKFIMLTIKVKSELNILALERIYNPITAMGFSVMFTFQLDNTKRQTLPAPHCPNRSCRYVRAASERKTTFTFLCLTHLSLLRTDQAEMGNSWAAPQLLCIESWVFNWYCPQ